MLLGGSQGPAVQWFWEIKKVMGGWDSHIMQMASLETSTSSFHGGYAQHQTLCARINFSARTMAAGGAEHTQSTSEHQGNAICVSQEWTRPQHHLLVGSSLG